jgi:Mg2+ and Co2+ transporter CorA
MLFTAFASDRAAPLDSLDAARTYLQNARAGGEHFVWMDTQFEEVTRDTEAWRQAVHALTGTLILDLHLQDARNATHPSYFDTTNVYDMVIFRKLTMQTTDQIAQSDGNPGASDDHLGRRSKRSAGFIPALAKIDTQPVVFFVFDHVLVTVRPGQSRTLEQVRRRLLEFVPHERAAQSVVHGVRPPTRPEDLMLRLLNAMVDRYLELRAPLTRQLDRWQRALLNPRYAFSGWEGLLDARIQLRKLEHLCEEQRDALQEFRDSLLDNTYASDDRPTLPSMDDALLVRINDVMEHVSRVLTHARRLEDSIESAVQIHFSAVAHRTNRTMRLLTLITALFMPLTLITGIFGMNFVRMPWVGNGEGFWWAMGLMGAVVAVLGVIFALARLSRD